MFSNKSLSKAQSLADQAGPLLDSANAQAVEMAQRVVDAVRDSSQQLQEQASNASDHAVKYIKAEPVKALLIAAATGAALMALANLMIHTRRRD